MIPRRREAHYPTSHLHNIFSDTPPYSYILCRALKMVGLLSQLHIASAAFLDFRALTTSIWSDHLWLAYILLAQLHEIH